jgi:hypothetical protein
VRTTPEEIIRIAVVPDAAKPLPIFDVIRGSQRHAPIASDCEWALVTHIPADSQGEEGYIVYYIDARGWPGDHDEFDTVDDALAHVERQTGISPSSWHVVSYTRVEPSPHAQFDASVLRSLSGSKHAPAV